MILVYTTHSDEAAAAACCEKLLEQRLIACANIFPIQSAYWWGGEITRDGEYVAIMKTTTSCWEALEQKILEIHPYEIPCIIRVEAHATPAYEDWIKAQVNPPL